MQAFELPLFLAISLKAFVEVSSSKMAGSIVFVDIYLSPGTLFAFLQDVPFCRIVNDYKNRFPRLMLYIDVPRKFMGPSKSLLVFSTEVTILLYLPLAFSWPRPQVVIVRVRL